MTILVDEVSIEPPINFNFIIERQAPGCIVSWILTGTYVLPLILISIIPDLSNSVGDNDSKPTSFVLNVP